MLVCIHIWCTHNMIWYVSIHEMRCIQIHSTMWYALIRVLSMCVCMYSAYTICTYYTYTYMSMTYAYVHICICMMVSRYQYMIHDMVWYDVYITSWYTCTCGYLYLVFCTLCGTGIPVTTSMVYTYTPSIYIWVALHGVLSTFMVWRYMGSGTHVTTHSVEGPKGELCIAMSTTGTRVWRCRIRPADLPHILCLQSYAVPPTRWAVGGMSEHPYPTHSLSESVDMLVCFGCIISIP